MPLGADGVISEPNRADGSCNAIFPKLGQIPKKNKDLVLTHADKHGSPSSRHARRVHRDGGRGQRVRLELLLESLGRIAHCAYDGTDCRYALGNTRQHRSNGRWSDGVAISPLKIQDAAPIRP